MIDSGLKKIIKITKCSNKEKGTLEEWYKDMIGREFEIYYIGYFYYCVKYINDKGNEAMNFINMKDVL